MALFGDHLDCRTQLPFFHISMPALQVNSKPQKVGTFTVLLNVCCEVQVFPLQSQFKPHCYCSYFGARYGYHLTLSDSFLGLYLEVLSHAGSIQSHELTAFFGLTYKRARACQYVCSSRLISSPSWRLAAINHHTYVSR